MGKAHGTSEGSINNKTVQQTIDQVNKDFKIENIVKANPLDKVERMTMPEAESTTKTSEVKEETIDFTLLRLLQAKKADNAIVKKLTRQCAAIVMGMVFHFLISAGSHWNFNLMTFLLIQTTLVVLLETYEKYVYTNKIDVSIPSLLYVCLQAIMKRMKKDGPAFTLPGVLGQLADYAEKASKAKGYVVSDF